MTYLQQAYKMLPKLCKCKMPYWKIDDLTHCAECGDVLPDIPSVIDACAKVLAEVLEEKDEKTKA